MRFISDIEQEEFDKFKDRQLERYKKHKKSLALVEGSRSLYIFSDTNSIRLFLKNIVQHPYFEDFILRLIFVNSLLLYLDEPILDNMKYQSKTIAGMLDIISIIFCIEAVLKIIVMGFYLGEETYLKDGWNVLDFTMVLVWVVS